MATKEKNLTTNEKIEALFNAGAHFGLIRSRRHPSVKPYLFGQKNRVEIFDLEKTVSKLEEAKEFVKSVVSNGGMVLFVGGKNEARKSIDKVGETTGMPIVSGRWLGGTLTNFSEIRKRISRLEDLVNQKEKGELAKYTKKERLLIDREIESLQRDFSGLTPLKGLPKAVFLVDPKREITAFKEAKKLKIPVVALSSSDCDIRDVDYPIPGNDSSIKSIAYVVEEISKSVEEGKRTKPEVKEEKAKKLD